MTNYQGYADSNASGAGKDAAKAADAIKDSVNTLGGHIKEDSLAIAQTAKDQAQKKVGDVSARVESYIDVFKKDMADHPVQTVAYAFAAGALAVMLLGRR